MSEFGSMKVAIDASLIQGKKTGDSTYWTGLLYGLQRSVADVKFLLVSPANKPEGLELDGRFQWITARSRSNRWRSMVTFPRVARRFGAHVIHTQYALSPFARGRGVTTVHDVSFMIGPEWFKPKDRTLLRLGVSKAVKWAEKVLAVSETCRSEIERYFPLAKGKVAVTFNACPPWIASVSREEAKRRVRDELGVADSFLITVGTRWPRKNMGLAVQAADRLDSRHPQPLVITGKFGWGDDGLGSRGRSVGYVSNDLLSCLYSAADLYLAPSRHEGFGVPVLEAFRCGCPVICSTGGALPEVAGDAAVVEASWEPASWCASIERLLDDPSKLNVLKAKGFEREKCFSWDSTAQRTLEVYREVAK